VTLPHHHHGLIFYKDFGDKWESARNKYSIGDEVRAVIINNHQGKLSLSLSQVNNPDLIDPTNEFKDSKDFTPLAKLVENSTKKIADLKNSIELSDQ
jgi:predicted RNA-binding protein with RPS1 domain